MDAIAALLHDCRTWLTGLHPEFVFLLALPFLVALAGLLGDAWLERRRPPR